MKLEGINNSYNKFVFESLASRDIDVFSSTIDSEIDQLTDLTFKLMKNKIALSEFYEAIENSIDNIESDLEEGEIPNKVKEYAQLIVKELLETKKRIMILANK